MCLSHDLYQIKVDQFLFGILGFDMEFRHRDNLLQIYKTKL